MKDCANVTWGKYKATVTMYERVDIAPGERSMVEPKLLTPHKYADVSTSGLEYEVSPGNNVIDIKLFSNDEPPVAE